MMVSARSRFAAGLFAAAAGTALVAPVAVPTAAIPSVPAMVSPAVQLSAALTPLTQPVRAAASTASAVGETPGDWIINAYFTVQPWVEYGVEVFAWATEWLPWPIGLLAPQADIIYSGWQPFAESVAFALAYLVDGQFDLVLPTLTFGIQTGISTFIQNEIAWIASFFPPLPRCLQSGSPQRRRPQRARPPRHGPVLRRHPRRRWKPYRRHRQPAPRSWQPSRSRRKPQRSPRPRLSR